MVGRQQTAPGGSITWAVAAFRQAGWLMLVTGLLTVLSWALRQERLPLVASAEVYELELAAPLLAATEAIPLYDIGDHLFIDTRQRIDDPREIPGSFRIRPATLDDDLRALRDIIYTEDPLILYGSGDLLPVSNVAGKLLERGFTDLQILGGGLQAWDEAGGELDPCTPVTGGAGDGN